MFTVDVSVVRLTDRPDMTLDVYRGRKTTIQQLVAVRYWPVHSRVRRVVLREKLEGWSLVYTGTEEV